MLTLIKGRFSIQFHRQDKKGNELTRIVDFMDDDVSLHNPKRNEIEFVLEVYFSLFTKEEKCLPVALTFKEVTKLTGLL